jgi:MOSC domain-containing protein YiiM/ferredoxin-NADP reductase
MPGTVLDEDQTLLMEAVGPRDLDAPFQNPTIVHIRTSKMKTMRNLTITTGIYKQPRVGRVYCSSTGLESDEHDLTFHGGVDKAVHQYCPSHYSSWAAEFPDQRDAFEVGAFGENLVCSGGMNERNVCIGDIYRVGDERDGAKFQVSLPRQPCFKLNHRFGIKNFAAQTWKKSRTGWYYRVLKEGWLQAGDPIVLLERKHPQWTIERIQEYLHRDKTNLEMLEELEKIDEFGKECKQAFKNLVASARAARDGANKKEPENWEKFQVVEKKMHGTRIAAFVFQKDGKGEEIDPGSFVRLKLPNGLVRSYSIVGGDTHRFQLGIALDANSRGGSEYLHHSLNQGDEILVGKITPSVPWKAQASDHTFIAAGIGITAFLAHMDVYSQINYNWKLHYAVRSTDDTPFKDILQKFGDKVVIYNKEKGERMNVLRLLQERKWNGFVYVCGPQRLIDDVVRSSNACGVGEDEIHYEAFQIATSGDPFTVELKQSQKTLEVPAEKTLLQVMREAGLEVDSSCEAGNCGTCRLEVCSGQVEHRGSALSGEDKAKAMLSCVSRGVGHIVIDF